MADVAAKRVMLRGSGGAKDYYLCLARGQMGLGFKILGMFPGPQIEGPENTVGMALRIRACAIDEPELEEIYPYGLEPSQQVDARPNKAFEHEGWGWKEMNATRASFIIKDFAGPDFSVDDKYALILPPDIESGALRDKLIKIIFGPAEPGDMRVLDEEQVAEIIQDYEHHMAEHIRSVLVQQKLIEETEEETLTTFKSGVTVSQNELAAKIKAKFVDAKVPDDGSMDAQTNSLSHQMLRTVKHKLDHPAAVQPKNAADFHEDDEGDDDGSDDEDNAEGDAEDDDNY